MIRRSIVFLLVILLLANQSLCLARVHHEHGAGRPEDHDWRPHFHLSGHVHHDDGHAHQHGSHEHDHHSHSDGPNAPSNPSEHSSTSPRSCPPLGDHDSDAVYGGGDPVTLASSDCSEDMVPAKDVVAGLISLQFEHRCAGLLHALPSRGQSSFFGDDACPIYLRALTLRL